MTTSPPPSDSAPAVKPMSIFGATGWTLGAHFALIAIVAVGVALREAALQDLVTLVFAQLIAYGLALFAILRIYAPEASVRRFVGLRRTAPLLYPLAVLFGAAVFFPMNKVLELTLAHFPREEGPRIEDMLRSAAPLRRVAVGVLAGIIVPFAEEVFFRGALFAPLRRFAELGSNLAPIGEEPAEAPGPISAAARRRAIWLTVMVTSLLFTIVHREWQTFFPLLLVACAVGSLRAWSGSLVPAILVHAGFNSTSVVLTFALTGITAQPWAWAIGGAACAAVTGYFMFLLCRDDRAAAARADEIA